MIKQMTCIECPVGCSLVVDVENCRVVKVAGNKCPRGEVYAASEIENPIRVLTSAVLSHGLGLKMVPVRTDKPIPKEKLSGAMEALKKIRVTQPLAAGDIIVSDFFGLGVNLVATRETKSK